MSIRTVSRTPTNQVDALVAISEAILQAYPTAVIILDGYSYPADFESNPSYEVQETTYNRRQTEEIIARDRAVADEIIARLRKHRRIGFRQAVVKMVGFPLLDSIAIATRVHFYFCHHGTVQHKIGWFTNAPGIVHGNLRTLALLPASWVAQQVERGTIPVYINADLVEDEPEQSGLSDLKKSLRVENYRLKNVDQLADYFIQSFQAAVQLPPARLRFLHHCYTRLKNKFCFR